MNSNYKLINGDCIDIMRKWPAGSIDLVLTDPPYLVNYQDKNGRSIQGDRSYSWLKPAFQEISRVLKYGRYCISFFGWSQAEKFLIAWKQAGLRPVGQLVFMKSYSSRDGILRSTHEAAYLLAKGKDPRAPNFVLNSIQPWSYSGNVDHPTTKPVACLTPLIGAFSNPGEKVLDPFLGSGSVGCAALETGRRFLGIEIDPEYFEVAKRRLERQTVGTAAPSPAA